MLTRDHRWKAARLAASAAEAESAGSGILAVWGYMHAATHVLNAFLQDQGVVAEIDCCASNHAGEYLDRFGRPLIPAAHGDRPGDLIHADMPEIEYPHIPELADAIAELRKIETLANRSMRTPWNPPPADVAAARSGYLRFQSMLADCGRDAR